MPTRPRRCPNCQFSYAWDGEFCGHCHTPYPRRKAWAACIEPHWFYRHHQAPTRQLVLFGCACVRTAGGMLPASASDLLDRLETTARRGQRFPSDFEAECVEIRDDVHVTSPITSPSRAAADALAQLGMAAAGADRAVFFQVAYLVSTATGISRIPDTDDERIGRPAFLDDPQRHHDQWFRAAVLNGQRPPGMTRAEELAWGEWQRATREAEVTRQKRAGATRAVTAGLCDLYRDVVPFPFEPTRFDPSWRTSTVVALAREMGDSRDYSAMPILADALQDAGCEDELLLGHCRGRLPHVPGCWVVEQVAG